MRFHVCACVCVCAQSCLTLLDPMDCSPTGSSGHGVFQARTLVRVAIFYSRGYSLPRDQSCISCISCIKASSTLYLLNIHFLLSLYLPSSPYISIAIRGMGSSGLVLCHFSLIWPWPLYHSRFAALVLGSGVLILAPKLDMALLSCLASSRRPSFQHLFLLLTSKP